MNYKEDFLTQLPKNITILRVALITSYRLSFDFVSPPV